VSSPLFGPDIAKLWPISYEGQSDTACFDNALEFLVQGGYSLAHAAMMLIPSLSVLAILPRNSGGATSPSKTPIATRIAAIQIATLRVRG
jgi:hypothetical protein